MIYNAKKLRLPTFFLMLGIVLSNSRAVLAEAVQLTPRPHEGSFSRVKTVVEVAGSLSVDNSAAKDAEKKTLSIPLKVEAEMFFDEQGLRGDYAPTLRHYWEAKADFEVAKGEDHRELREDRPLVLLTQGISANERYTSPYGPLQREEIELIDVASNAFPPERLLPNRSVEVDDVWTHKDEEVVELLRLSSITQGELKSEVAEITSDTVTINISGEVEGKVDGVVTQIEVKGNYHFDRNDKVVKWIALAVRENREIGFAAPGFNVVSRIRTVREAISSSDALTPSMQRKVSLRPTDSDKLLDFVSEDKTYRMAMNRGWYLLSHRKFSSMLRMVEDGDLLATCKIDTLTKSVPGKQVTLDGFRDDVQKALDKNCKEIVSASQSVNSQGVRVLRVVAAGEVAETPIQWIYYHLSNDDGRRLSFIFTLESSMESRFAGSDEEMTSSVKFLKVPEEQVPEAQDLEARAATESDRK